MDGPHSSENRWTLGAPRCWNGDPARVNTALVGPRRGGPTSPNESLGTAGNNYHPSDEDELLSDLAIQYDVALMRLQSRD
ncbi:jg14058 [Pararge aegeria aegeria]|uniref:Jg14058 protein n=1 Tax=Pararge aegeria aegeria TaxID=348720 RepID=A0A8S4SPY0_9NEOP|nr:jg14058 [Pararge aegeria aegeria]